jgi:hypothetical protein
MKPDSPKISAPRLTGRSLVAESETAGASQAPKRSRSNLEDAMSTNPLQPNKRARASFEGETPKQQVTAPRLAAPPTSRASPMPNLMNMLPQDTLLKVAARLKKVSKESGASEWEALCNFLSVAQPLIRPQDISEVVNQTDFDKSLKNKPLTINLNHLPHLTGAEGLKKFGQYMEVLQKAGVHTIALAGARITDAHLALLPAGIQSLTIDRTCKGVSDAGIANRVGLTALDIEECEHLKGHGYEKLTELTALFASSSGLDDDAMAHWSAMKKLTVLSVGGCESFGGTHVSVLPALKDFYATGCYKLNEMDIARSTSIERMDIDCCDQITGQGFIGGLPALKWLSACPSEDDDELEDRLTLQPEVIDALKARGCEVHVE